VFFFFFLNKQKFDLLWIKRKKNNRKNDSMSIASVIERKRQLCTSFDKSSGSRPEQLKEEEGQKAKQAAKEHRPTGCTREPRRVTATLQATEFW